MASSFATVFAQQFSSFCLKKNMRVVSALPDIAARFMTQNAQESGFPLYNFLLDKAHINACEDWITQQHYSIVFRHIAADYTSYWLHDIEQSDIIHVRFIHHIGHCGVTLLELNAIQQRATFKQLFYHPDPIDQALIILLYYGFKERNRTILTHYGTLLQSAFAQADTSITERLMDLFGHENALNVERNIKRYNNASDAADLPRHVFFYRAWTRMGGDIYQDMAVHAYYTLYNMLHNRAVDIVLLGGTEQRKTDLTTFLKQELRTLPANCVTFSGTGISPFWARLTRRLVMTAYLDKSSLSQAKPVSGGLVLPNEINLERSQGLLLNHLIARLDRYFSDNPI